MTDADSRPGVGRRGDVTNYGDPGFSRFMRRAFAKGMGYTGDDLQRPVIGICNSWSELNHCNRHLRQVADAVKRGVWAAGGWPMEFPTISLGEIFTSPTAMLYRNLMALDAEEMSRAQPVDGVIFLANCDKTTPAYLMAAASADLPAMVFTGGPMLNGRWRGQDLGACTDCRRYWTEYRAGALSTSGSERTGGCALPVNRSLHGDGDGIHHGRDHRRPRDDPAGCGGDPRGGLCTVPPGGGSRPAHGRHRGRGFASLDGL